MRLRFDLALAHRFAPAFDKSQHFGSVALMGRASTPCEQKLANIFELVQAVGRQSDVERFLVNKS